MPDLKHVGILGMKWGRRKARGPSSDDHKSAKALSKKKIHEMSNDELKKIRTRLQLEKSYKDLKASNISTGRKIVTGILVGAATTATTAFVAKQATNGLDFIAKSIIKG